MGSGAPSAVSLSLVCTPVVALRVEQHIIQLMIVPFLPQFVGEGVIVCVAVDGIGGVVNPRTRPPARILPCVRCTVSCSSRHVRTTLLAALARVPAEKSPLEANGALWLCLISGARTSKDLNITTKWSEIVSWNNQCILYR